MMSRKAFSTGFVYLIAVGSNLTFIWRQKTASFTFRKLYTHIRRNLCCSSVIVVGSGTESDGVLIFLVGTAKALGII